MRKFFGILFALVFSSLLLMPQSGECYVTLRYKDVPAGFLSMKLPADTYIIEYIFNEAKDFVPSNEYRNREEMQKSAFSFYQLAIEDNGDYKTAWVVIFSDARKFKDEEMVYFNDLTQERKEEILTKQAIARDELQKHISEKQPVKLDLSRIRKIDLHDYKWDREIEIVAFSWPDIEFPMLGGKQAFTNEARIAGNFFGFFAAGYAKGYILSVDDRGCAIAFLCIDSEKDFWRSVMDRAVQTIR